MFGGNRLDRFAYGTQVYVGKTLCNYAEPFNERNLPGEEEFKVINVRCKKPVWGTDITIMRADN